MSGLHLIPFIKICLYKTNWIEALLTRK